MHVADTYLGHRDDDEISARLDEQPSETVTVGPVERRRSRFRTTTREGTELGVTVGRELQDGDVLEADGTLIVVKLDAVSAFSVALDDVASVAAGVEFGHALGNRHRDLCVRDDEVLIRAPDDAIHLEQELTTLLPADATVERTAVSPTAFDSEPDYSHSHPHPHSHSHSHGHAEADHNHDHGHDHNHDHEARSDSEGSR